MIRIEHLELSFGSEKVLSDITLNLKKGVPLSIIGESGAGKSSLALSLMGMSKGHIKGDIWIEEFNVSKAKEDALQKYRGKDAAMVFQHLSDSLNPQIPIIEQVIEPLTAHNLLNRADSLEKASKTLLDLGIDEEKHHFFPYQLSGGQIQRVMLAMASITDPKLLILDEPTAALDPSNRERIVSYIRTLSIKRYMMLITHDMDIARHICPEIAILYGGRILEKGPVQGVLDSPRHPYTRGLIRSRPDKGKRKDLQGIPGRYTPSKKGCVFAGRCTQKIEICEEESPLPDDVKGHTVFCHRKGIVTLLSVKNLEKSFNGKPLFSQISLSLAEGETLSITGPSGSGKSTIARIIMGLEKPDQGKVSIDLPFEDNSHSQKIIQFVSQNPRASLSRRFTILDLIKEPLDIQKIINEAEKKDRVFKALEDTQLPTDDTFLHSLPGHLSGGELQRLSIARALVSHPKIIVADEPTSALDVSIQAKILRLLMDLQEKRGLSLLFITHDMDLAEKISDRIIVLASGRLTEQG